jgi:MYXO-CTERM domain-containing protein
LAVAAGLALPALAAASNTDHPRTLVIWDGGGGECRLPELSTPCATVHERSDTPLHIPYRIPFEDTAVGPDEVADSRTHQFVAFCRQHPFAVQLPSWITQADAADASAIMQVPEGGVPTSDILELRRDWDDCWHRIVEDADRRAITCENAEAGVDWDTMATPPGVYRVEAYTYEPAFNFWVPRPGFVKLHDGDPDAVGPAVAVKGVPDATVHRNQIEPIEGCVDAPDGSTMQVYWAEHTKGAPEWIPYGDPQPATRGDLLIEFAPPAESFGKLVTLRVDVEDPEGRSYTAYTHAKLSVIDADGPCEGGSFVGGSSCDDTGGDSSSSGGEPASTTGGDTTTAGSSSSTAVTSESSGDVASQTGESKGCGCASDRAGAWPMWLVVVGALVRRRRSPAAP